jgi:Fe-S cluster biogenesis protein NfuA
MSRKNGENWAWPPDDAPTMPTNLTQGDLAAAVLSVLDTQVRPLLAMHGGALELIDVTAAGEVRLAFEGACCGCSLKSVTYALGIRQKLMPIPGVTEVTVEGVRLSRAALARAERMYGGYSPWVGNSPSVKVVSSDGSAQA